MIKGKYKRFARNVVYLSIASLLMLLSSCGVSSNTITYPLSESPFKDKRFLDTIQEKTTFYFGILNTEGYDRFGGSVFEDLQRKITLRNSVSSEPKQIEYYYGEIQRKGIKTDFIVNGVFVNEPKLQKIATDSTASIVTVQKAVESQNKATPPEAANIIIQAKKVVQGELTITKPAKTIQKPTEETVEKLDDRLIIIACFKEGYFDESMLEPYRNELSDIAYYSAKGWVRIYLTDFPGYRIWEAKEVFPDAWRAYYGE